MHSPGVTSHKGFVSAGSTVRVRLALDGTAQGPARLLVAYGRSGGTPDDETGTVAPGAQATLSIATDVKGRLRILLDTRPADTGFLEVSVDGAVRDTGSVQGQTTWTYAVIPPAAAPPAGGAADEDQ
jgi:hypothetical protein